MAEKLVRNFIPYVILKNDGKLPRVRLPKDHAEVVAFFIAKLDEEVAELKKALLNPAILPCSNLNNPARRAAVKDVIEETADVMEVLRNLSPEDQTVERMKEKRRERGGFDQHIIVDFE